MGNSAGTGGHVPCLPLTGLPAFLLALKGGNVNTFYVKNFEHFQHYKDRSPPWIKLYNELLDDYDFACLQDASKLHLILIWLLASRADNKLPYDADWISKRINATTKVNLGVLVDAGFLVINQELQTTEQVASAPLADCKQVARPERERETERETEKKIAEPIGSRDTAPTDFRKELFGRGLRVLTEITGKTPDSSRSLVGRWLKFVNDEAIHVLGAIEEAERNKIADPVAWITKVLQSKMGNRDGKPTVHDAAKAQLERFRSLNEPSGLRDGAGTNPVRLLPTR